MAVRKTKKGAALRRWFKEEWIDVRTGKPCGRTKGDGRGVPYCRPKKRVSSKTPKTASEMSASEKKKKVAEKKDQLIRETIINTQDKVEENSNKLDKIDEKLYEIIEEM